MIAGGSVAPPAARSYAAVMDQPATDGPVYWYNLRTGQVETEGSKSRGEDLMGPYATHDEAAHALQKARERTEEWDEADRRWNEGEDD